jgi:transposase
MAIVMGLDQHRAQITAEWIDTETGEVSRGRIVPADRPGVRKFLARFRGLDLEVALEATTGWRFVVEELRQVGAEVHLAEAAQTSALRGSKQHAKNDRADARHLRELLIAGRSPECWIAPDHLLDLRARVRLRHSLVDERGECQPRMQAVLYHARAAQACRPAHRREPGIGRAVAADRCRAWADHGRAGDDRCRRGAGLTARARVALLLAPPGRLQGDPGALRDRRADERRGPRRARRRTPVLLLQGGGPLRRARHHRARVRQASRARTPIPARTARAALALYEAAQTARRKTNPDHAYYRQAAERLGDNRALLSVMRKLLKRSYHTLRELCDDALAPA